MTRAPATRLEMATTLAAARLGRRPPAYLVHALTARCNARCGFCAWNPDAYDPRDQLPTEAIERLYTDARRAGFIGLSIWGGEPLLHRDFDRIVGRAHGLGFATHMVTNGFLLARRMDAVVAHVDRLCISVDHPSPKHDEIRGIRGLFDRIVASTREIRRREPRKPIVFIYTLQKGNVDAESLLDMAELLRSLGVLGVFNGLREDTAAGDEDARIEDHAPSAEQLSQAFIIIDDLKRRGYPILNSRTHIGKMRSGPPVYRCHWPKFMLPVEANGDVVDCMHWGTRPLGNLRETPLATILESPRLRELAGNVGEACHKCVSVHRVEISEVCDGNLEPVLSWRMLRKGALRVPRGGDLVGRHP
jgi:MoaA/NifB/PqqE/SkfB family radical SAM enzyme